MSKHPPEPLDQEALFDLTAVGDELRHDAAYERDGHVARTLVREPDLRVVLMVMKQGSRMTEHDASDTVSVHVLAGHLRVTLPRGPSDLRPARLLVIQRALKHDVLALEDSTFVLTLGWHARS